MIQPQSTNARILQILSVVGQAIITIITVGTCLPLFAENASQINQISGAREFQLQDVKPGESESKGPADIDFKLVTISNGLTEDGFFTSTLELSTPKGNMVYKATAPFDNARRANEEFQKLLKHAESIVRRTAETNKDGRVTGERILATFSCKNSNDFRFRLFWTGGSWFHEIYGNSVDDVLALER
ncbi:MAG TPA: hypothetical protein VN982_10960, partial [Candidatus Dormibacteraeota bacterium]|nr:hypothetical protein [Candidatus Dormibacteraeota bacterium]